jgi:hypothetical protein
MGVNTIDQKLSRGQRLNLILRDSQAKSYFVIAVTFLFFLLFTISSLLPAIGNVLSGNSEISTVKQAIELITKKRDDILKLKGEKDSKSAVLAKLDSALPETNNQEDTIVAIYRLANYVDGVDINSQSMIIKQITFNLDARKALLQLDYKVGLNVRSTEFSLLAEGDLDSLRQFIRNLENSSKIFSVRRLIINKRTGEVANQVGENRQYVLNLTAEYFTWGLPVDSSTQPVL